MKNIVLSVLVTLFSISAAAVGPKPNFTVKLYPEGQGVDKGIVENGVNVTLGPGESNGLTGPETDDHDGRFGNVNDDARLDIYLPKHCNGQMIVDIPGGGYSIVSTNNEGVYVADWCLKHGIAVCVVVYRLPNKHHTVPLTDVQNAFRYCRAHAAEWGVKQIGVMGFSAGGHLAATASNLFVDDITRPDFSVLIYPVITMGCNTHSGSSKRLTGEKPSLKSFYSMEERVSVHTPKTLLMLSADDATVPPVNSLKYYEALQENHVQGEIHIFSTGGHGYGFNCAELGLKDKLGAEQRADFFRILERWLSDRRAEIK